MLFLPKIHGSGAICEKSPAALCPIEPSTCVTWRVIISEVLGDLLWGSPQLPNRVVSPRHQDAEGFKT